MKKVESNVAEWVPMIDGIQRPELVVNYEGNYADKLEINSLRLGRFLSLAALEGRVLVRESRLNRSVPMPEVNPDGSMARKGLVRWKPNFKSRKVNPYLQVDSDKEGWVIGVNGKLIAEDIVSDPDQTYRGGVDQFARRFDDQLQSGLGRVLLRDKLTRDKDPYVLGRLIGSICVAGSYYNLPHVGLDAMSIFWLGFNLLGQISFNTQLRDQHLDNMEMYQDSNKRKYFFSDVDKYFPDIFMTFARRTIKSKAEMMLLPLELDRLVLGLGYLGRQSFRGSGFVRSVRA